MTNNAKAISLSIRQTVDTTERILQQVENSQMVLNPEVREKLLRAIESLLKADLALPQNELGPIPESQSYGFVVHLETNGRLESVVWKPH